MDNNIPPTPQALDEALQLSGEILKDIELSSISLAKVALKASRLARLLNQENPQQIFAYEASGYPTSPDGIAPNVWRLLEMAGRTYQEKDSNSKSTKTLAFLESIEQLEEELTAAKLGLEAAKDHPVSLSSANPNQFVMAPTNFFERQGLHTRISTASQRLSSRRTLLYQYATRRYYELKFSAVAQDVFSSFREQVDSQIGKYVPSATKKFAAVLDNLRSENPEDWSNAVHSCRRILQDLADAVFPAQTTDRIINDEKGKSKTIKLGPDQYINRLICFAQDNSESKRFTDLVGSHMSFLGDRLDAVFSAAQKGSHSNVSRDEANRYVLYTYMIAGDILSLLSEKPNEV